MLEEEHPEFLPCVSFEIDRLGRPHTVVRIPAVHPTVTDPLTLYISPDDFSWGWVDGHHEHNMPHRNEPAYTTEDRASSALRQVRQVMNDEYIFRTVYRNGRRTRQSISPPGWSGVFGGPLEEDETYRCWS